MKSFSTVHLFQGQTIEVCLCVCESVPYCFSVQLLVDLNDPTERVNEELVVSVSADDGVEDCSIQLTVHVLC